MMKPEVNQLIDLMAKCKKLAGKIEFAVQMTEELDKKVTEYRKEFDITMKELEEVEHDKT